MLAPDLIGYGPGDFNPPDPPDDAWEDFGGTINTTALRGFTAHLIERADALTQETARQAGVLCFTRSNQAERERAASIDSTARELLVRLRELESFLRGFEDGPSYDVTSAGLELLRLKEEKNA